MERIEQLQGELNARGIDALFLRLPENVMLAAGWWVQIPGLGIAVVPAVGRPALLIPEYEAHEAPPSWTGDLLTFPAIRFDGPSAATEIPRLLRELVHELGLRGAVVGYEGSFEAVAPPQIDGEPNTVARGPEVRLDGDDLERRADDRQREERADRPRRPRTRLQPSGLHVRGVL